MKKIVSVLLALVLLASSAMLFSSCANKTVGANLVGTMELDEFVIGITYFEPMNYFDANGKLTGFETEFAEAVCAKLNLTPKFVEIDWNTKEVELNAGSIDCIWNGLTVTDERSENMALTNAYMANKQVLVVKADRAADYADSANLAGMSVCAEEGSAGEEVAMGDELFAKANYTGVSTQAMALMEVEAGTSDGCVIDYVTSVGMIGEGTDYADLVVVDAYEFAVEYYAIAFANSNSAMRDTFNTAIAELIADGTVGAIAAKYKLADRIVK